MEIGPVACGAHRFERGRRTLIMGIVNVTPDSFSDAGDFIGHDDALRQCEQLFLDGADIVDIGAVSTAPGARPVSEEDELRRLMPLLDALSDRGFRALSIDTTRARVAKEALDRGVAWINDQSAGRADSDMPKQMARADGVVLMHSRGRDSGVTAGENVAYADLVGEITHFFEERIRELAAAGVARHKIIVDPGVGFGKGLHDSLAIITHMHCFAHLGALTLIGVSRKSFLKSITGIEVAKSRDMASLGAAFCALESGADMVRTHNVRATKEMALVFDQCRNLQRCTQKDMR